MKRFETKNESPIKAAGKGDMSRKEDGVEQGYDEEME